MSGNQIKYKLGLLRIISDLFETYSVAGIKDLQNILPRGKLREFARERFIDHFPYLGDGDEVFNIFYPRVIKDLERGINPDQYIKFFKSNYFQEELESISASVLFHFISPEYFLDPLRLKRLFPSKVNIWEFYYNPLDCETELRLNESARSYLGEALQDTQGNLLGLEQAEAVVLNNKIKYVKSPIFNCFTDISINSVSFHAAHYGSCGIAFNKESILKKINARKSVLSKISPVSYQDPYKSTSYKLLINEYFNNRKGAHSEQYLMDLLTIKIMLDTDLRPSNYYSAFFEREWRYVSYEASFEFDYKDIEFITLPKASCERHFVGIGERAAPVEFISDILNFAHEHDIKILPIESKIDELEDE